jgi:hypothetical protein
MKGLYLLAAELSGRELIVSPTSRSAEAADLLVTDRSCKNVFAVQVKTNARTFNFWLVNANTSKTISDSLVYALVNLKKSGPEYYFVPSCEIAKKVRVSKPSETRKTTWYSVYEKDISDYKDNWGIFRNQNVEPDAEADRP